MRYQDFYLFIHNLANIILVNKAYNCITQYLFPDVSQTKTPNISDYVQLA